VIYASGGSGGAVAGLIVFFLLYIGCYFAYAHFLRNGLRARTVVTSLPIEQIRALFSQKVAGLGWKVVDDDNPMVAQSPLLAGRRQQIELSMTREANGIRCVIRPSRYWKKIFGLPYKAHTLRMRLNAFERAVSAHAVPGCSVAPSPMTTSASPSQTPLASSVVGQWSPDPFNRHELRYHDGTRWTETVSNQGHVSADPPEHSPATALHQVRPPDAESPQRWEAPDLLQHGPPPQAASDDHDGHTMTRAQVEALRPEAFRSPSFAIHLDNGLSHKISGLTLVGRNPAPRDGEQIVGLVSIPDETMTASKTHLSLRIENGELLVEDRSSNNGTVVRHLDGTSVEVGVGTAVPVRLGSTVSLGDRTFTVKEH
jgi:hypothetical protein